MSEKVTINLEIDITALKEAIEGATNLNDNEEVFNALAEVFRTKKEITDVLDRIAFIESEAKGLINSKANALYGNEWSAIKGDGYKISKSFTGSVFNILEDVKPPKKFVKIKESLDSKLVEEYIKETGKLPKGIEYNPNRGASIRVTING